jgi:hypothetical protein
MEGIETLRNREAVPSVGKEDGVEVITKETPGKS